MRTKRWSLVGIACSLLAVLVSISCSVSEDRKNSRQDSVEQPRVRVGVLEHSSSIPIIVAYSQGFFREEGISVELRTLSAAEHMPTLVRGDVEALSPSSFPVIFSAAQHNPGQLFCYLVGGESLRGDVLYGIVVPDRSRHNSLGDLIGGTVASGSRFTTVNLRNVLRSALGDERDSTEIITMSDRSLLLSGVASGEFDAAVLDQPSLSQAVSESGVKIIEPNFRARYLGDPYWSGAGVASLPWATDNDTVFSAYVAALDRALQFIAQNPSRAREDFSKYFQLADVSHEAIGMYVYPSAAFIPPDEFLDDLVGLLAANEILAPGFSTHEVFPDRLLKARDDSVR